jgi:hypothetical protein
MENSSDIIAQLMAAEVAFLMAFGWTPVALPTGNGSYHAQFKCPKTGDLMDRWAAVARQKLACDFPA